jgi:hypothetical protein
MNRQQRRHPPKNPKPLIHFREKTGPAPEVSDEIVFTDEIKEGIRKFREMADENRQKPMTLEDRIKELLESAKAGDTEAMNELGYQYLKFQHDFRFYHVASNWFRNSATRGSSQGQYRYGLMLILGLGTEINASEGMRMLTASAHQENLHAQALLGELLLEDPTAAVDSNDALHWIKEAAKHAHEGAQLVLGDCYRTGDGVPIDGSKALYWYRKSAEERNIDGNTRVGMCYMNGVGVAKDMGKAKENFTLAAKQGEPYACFLLGGCYSGLGGLPKNEKAAFAWFERAAIGGNAEAIQEISQCYEMGIGVDKNQEMSIHWYYRHLQTRAPSRYENMVKRLHSDIGLCQ